MFRVFQIFTDTATAWWCEMLLFAGHTIFVQETLLYSSPPIIELFTSATEPQNGQGSNF